MVVLLLWLLFILSVVALLTELNGETRLSQPHDGDFSWVASVLTVRVKHSGDKANRWRLVGVLL